MPTPKPKYQFSMRIFILLTTCGMIWAAMVSSALRPGLSLTVAELYEAAAIFMTACIVAGLFFGSQLKSGAK